MDRRAESVAAVRFKIASVELALEVAVTLTGTGTAGIKWWLLKAGGGGLLGKQSLRRIGLTLDQVTLDTQAGVVSIVIDDDDTTDNAD